MRYKYSLSPELRPTVEWHLSHYPDDKRELEQQKTDLIPSPIAGYSLTAGVSGGAVHRSTEDVMLSIESNQYVRRLTQSCDAIGKVLDMLPPEDIKLIELVYWKHEFTPEGAGAKLHMSRRTAYRHVNNILTAVALEMGYVSA